MPVVELRRFLVTRTIRGRRYPFQVNDSSRSLRRSRQNQRATVVRGLLLSNCLELRGIIARGTTHAYGIPIDDVLRQSQLLLLAYRQMRSNKLN
jgi:hypothetical protein